MTNDRANRRIRLLVAYNAQLRTDTETSDAISVTRPGPLRLVTFAEGRCFISHHDLGDVTTVVVRRLVPEALSSYHSDPDIVWVEWKTHGHDYAPGLLGALLEIVGRRGRE